MTSPVPDPYSRRLQDLILEHDRRLATLEKGQRATQLGNSSIEDDFIAAYDALGQARQIIGRQTDGTFSITYGNGPAPPTPSGLAVIAAQLSLIVQWDGTFVGNVSMPKDFARLDVHVSEITGFTPSPVTIVASLYGEGAVSFFADSDTKYVKVVAVNSSDVASASTSQVTILPLPADQIAAGAIGAAQLAALIVLTTRLVVGDPSGARIELNGTTNEFKAVDSGGTAQILMDGDTGDVTFRGTYRTDDDGQRRIIINDDVTDTSTIRFFAPGDDVDHGALFQVGSDKVFTVCGFTLSSNRGELIFDGRTGAGFAMLHYGTPQGWLGGSKSLFYADVSQAITQGPTLEFFVTEQYTPSAFGSKMVFGIKDSTGALINSTRLDFKSFGTSPNREPWFVSDNRAIGLIWGNAKLHVTNSSTTYTTAPIRASAFEVFPSSRVLKTDVEELEFDALAVVENARSYQWKVKGDKTGRGHIGPMLEDLPDGLKSSDSHGDGLDLSSLVGTLMAAVQKLSSKVTDLENKYEALERRGGM